MKFCDFCEKDVVKPCTDLEMSDLCANKEVIKIQSPVIIPDSIKVTKPVLGNELVVGPIEDLQVVSKVEHPNYYNRGPVEVKDFCMQQGLCPQLKEAVCYLVRAYHKDPNTWKEDLEKAIFNINDLIEQVDETGYFPIVEAKKVPTSKDQPPRNS